MGDSNADHFSEGLIAAAARLDRPVYVSVGCVFVDMLVQHPLNSNDSGLECRTNTQNILEWLDNSSAGTVVIANSDHYWTENSGFLGYSGWMVGDDQKSLVTDPQDRVHLFGKALDRTVAALKSSGHDVVLVQTVPHYEAPDRLFSIVKCSLLSIFTNKCSQIATTEQIDRVQGPPRVILENLAQSDSTRLVDFRDYFCRDGYCITQRNDTWLYRDGHHISVRASEELAPMWFRALS